MSFQKSVNIDQPVGIEGSWAADTARSVRGAIAVAAGVVVGRAVWLYSTDPEQVQNSGTGVPFGIALRDLTGIITTFLAESTMTILAGLPVEVVTQGDLYVKTSTVTAYGQKVFANLTTGAFATGAAGATIAGHIETPWKVARRSAGAIGDLIHISTWVNT